MTQFRKAEFGTVFGAKLLYRVEIANIFACRRLI
jgi:hypothetical protein